MQTYEIPRNYKGEGRILYIFSTKGLIFTCVGAGIGLVFYFILRMLGFGTAGLIITVICAAIGFVIGTLKVPESNAFEITKKTGGENIDDVIKRAIKFKMNRNRIYIYDIDNTNKKNVTNEKGGEE